MLHDCNVTKKIVLLLLVSLFGLTTLLLNAQTNPPIVINSYFNAGSPNDEWTELVVVQDNLDLRGWNLRDNNATQDSWQEPIFFKNTPFWQNLRKGTIIIINHRSGSLPFDDLKADGFIRVSADDSRFFSGGSFPNSTLSIAGAGDLLEIRNSGTHLHSLGHQVSVGSSYNELPFPKLNHSASLSNNEAVMVCPGSNLNEFGSLSPQNGNIYTSKSSTKIAGIPNSCGTSADGNSNFLRQLREPSWSSPSAGANYNENTHQIGLFWNSLSDDNPSDLVQGYLLLRNTTNNFVAPTDGVTYLPNQIIGSATVVDVLTGSGSTSYNDTYTVTCGQPIYYRIYGFRYNTDNTGGNNVHQARGRAYNTNNFAATSVSRLEVTPLVSITANPTGIVPPGTNVTFTPSPTYGGSPTYKWFVNEVEKAASPTYTYIPQNGDKVYAAMTTTLECVTNSTVYSNIITLQVTPSCNPGIISGPAILCLNSSSTYSTSGSSGGLWSSSNPAVVSINPGTGVATAHTSGLATLKYTVGGCVGNTTAQYNVAINPNANAGADQSHCNLLTTNLLGNTPLAGSGYWSQMDGPAIVEFTPHINSPSVTVTAPVPGVYIFLWNISEGDCSSSDMVVVDFKPLLPVSVSINPVNTNVCQGTQVAFQANPINGGSGLYDWLVNGVVQFNHAQNFLYTPAHNDQVRVRLTSNLSCVSGNPALSEIKTMTVNPTTAVSASVVASQNPVCAGETVHFTLSYVNAGADPTIQWFKNGNLIQTGGLTYSYTPAHGDKISAQVGSNNNCAANNPANSNTITLVVTPTVQPTITLSGPPEVLCNNIPVTITAITTYAGSAPGFVWYLNGEVLPDVNGPAYSYLARPGDKMKVQLTSNHNCLSTNTVMSSELSINVLQSAVAPTSVSSDKNNYCANEGGNITLTAIEGAGDIVKWYADGCGTTLLGSDTSFTLPAPASNKTFYARWETASCGLSSCKSITINVLPEVIPTISITANTSEICFGEPVVFTAQSTNAGTMPVYSWKVNGIEMQSSASSTFTSNSLNNGDEIRCDVLSSASCAPLSPVQSNNITIAVGQASLPTIAVSTSQTTVCFGTSIHFTSNIENGGSSPTVAWLVNGNIVGNGNSFSYVFPTTGTFSVQATVVSSLPCAQNDAVFSNTLSIVVQPLLPVSVSISANPTSVCEGSPMVLNTNLTNAGDNPNFVWYVNGAISGSNTSTFNFTPNFGDAVTVQLTSNALCATNNPAVSNTFYPVVNSLALPANSIVSSANTICANDNGNIILSVSGGQGSVIEWFSNSCSGMPIGLGESITVPSPSVTTSYFVRYLTQFCGTSPCVSTTVTVSDVIVPEIALSTPQTEVCQDQTVTVTATTTGQGNDPLFEWRLNGVLVGNNSNTYSFIPLDGQTITCSLTSSESCAEPQIVGSEAITFSVNPNVIPVVSISASANDVCENTEISFEAQPEHGGSSPVYQWKINGDPVGTNDPFYTYLPSNNDEVRCEMTSSESCVSQGMVSSNNILMHINSSLTPSIALTASATAVCEGTAVEIATNVSHPGTNPTYQWFVNGVEQATTLNSFGFIPEDGAEVYCMLTSDTLCADPPQVSSEVLTFAVSIPVQPTITVTADALEVCEGALVTLTGTVTGEGNSPVYEWLVNGNKVASTAQFTYQPANGDEVICRLSSSEICAQPQQIESTPIQITVNESVFTQIIVETEAVSLCEGEAVVVNTNIDGGGENPNYSWFLNGVLVPGADPTYSFYPSNEDHLSCMLISSEQCASNPELMSNVLVFDVSPLVLPAISISNPQDFVCEGAPVQLVANVSFGGLEPQFEWFVNNQTVGNNSDSFSFTPNDGEEVFCAMTSTARCVVSPTVASNVLQMNVLENISPSITIQADAFKVCRGSAVAIQSFVTGGGNQAVFQWFLNGQPLAHSDSIFSFVPSNSDRLYCAMVSSENCITESPSLSNELNFELFPVIEIESPLLQHPSCNLNNGSIQVQLNGGTAPFEYSLSNGASWQTSSIFKDLTAGSYSIMVKDGEGCTEAQSTGYLLESIPPPTLQQPIITACNSGESNGSISVVAVGEPPLEYSMAEPHWQADGFFDQLNIGFYTLQVKDGTGCKVSTDFEITELFADFEPGIPNAFRPVSNPPNNSFKPVFGQTTPIDYRMFIFNSWGQVVYETFDSEAGWDGSMNGQAMPQGVYAYTISFKLRSFSDDNIFSFTKKGTVTLLR